MPKPQKIKVGRLLALQENPVEAREDVGKIIRREMLAALEGSGFFDELAGYAGSGLGRGLGHGFEEGAPAATASAKKRKLTDKMRRRNELVRKLMREEGLSLPAASKAVKERGLA